MCDVLEIYISLHNCVFSLLTMLEKTGQQLQLGFGTCFLQVKSWLPALTDLIYQVYQVCQLPVQLIHPAKPCKTSTTFCIQLCRTGFWTNESSLWAGLHRKTIQNRNQVTIRMSYYQLIVMDSQGKNLDYYGSDFNVSYSI